VGVLGGISLWGNGPVELALSSALAGEALKAFPEHIAGGSVRIYFESQCRFCQSQIDAVTPRFLSPQRGL